MKGFEHFMSNIYLDRLENHCQLHLNDFIIGKFHFTNFWLVDITAFKAGHRTSTPEVRPVVLHPLLALDYDAQESVKWLKTQILFE